LFSWAATLGVYVWSGPEAVLNQHIFKVESFLNKNFHRYLIEACLDEMKAKTHGSGMVHITKSKFDEIPVLIPPSDEQEEIVRILEEQFSRLDAIAVAIAAVRSKADQFRRSLLHAAFTGALTHTIVCRVSSTTKASSFPPGPGWLMTSLAEHVKHKSGDSKIIKGKQSASPGPGLVQGFSASGPDVWVKQLQYHGPGVVVSAVGARCGKTFLADGEWTAIANTHALIPKDGLDPKYLWYVTNREEWWVKSGTAQPFVKVKDTLERPFHLPSLAEQQKIVQILEEQFSRQEVSLALVDAVERKVGALRRSLLHAAFSGELTKVWREKNNV
jgi:hypothetical protein